MEYEVKAEMKFNITDEDIDDIMCAALEGGIYYWCDKAEVVEDEYLGEYASDQISRGGSLRLYDCESDDTFILTKEKFLEGVKRACEEGYAKEWLEDGNIDASMIGSDDADVIVQFALFGEVVFG